jgi:hypothetical protein
MKCSFSSNCHGHVTRFYVWHGATNNASHERCEKHCLKVTLAKMEDLGNTSLWTEVSESDYIVWSVLHT